MILSHTQIKLLIFFSVVLLFAGCKQPETIVIDESPTTTATEDTTTEDTATGNEASFRQLVVGEYSPIKSMDPLLVENLSEMRAIQLLYEGLVRLDENGSVVPGIARDWSVGDDSLRYTFTIRPDVFYHDSEVFSTGTGRKLTSRDVKFVFERMAQSGVPPTAAQMFMDIEGFEPYYQEQRNIYIPQNRQLDEVAGIQAPNDTTVTFELTQPDTNFLKKMATPYAVIYPREAVGRTVSSFAPVGTGPFIFSQSNSDSTYIFSKFQNYYAASEIDLNRVDLQTSTSESGLFQAMNAGDIHLLPQLGPQLVQTLLTPAGELMSSYNSRYNLQKPQGAVGYEMRYNSNSNLSQSSARQIAGLIRADSGSFFTKLPNGVVTAQTKPDSMANDTNITREVYTTYSDDPYIQTFLGTLTSTLAEHNITLQMMRIRASTQNTGIFFTQNYPLISAKPLTPSEVLFSFNVKQIALMHPEINGLQFNQYPWWFDLRDATLPAIENL